MSSKKLPASPEEEMKRYLRTGEHDDLFFCAWPGEDLFADFLVHEVAHIFHNCKRRTIGLRETRGREWLLEIDFVKRETFAYACEAYARILELGEGPPARRKLLSELEEGPMPADERLDAGEYVDILREAVAARNGWKRILQRCARPHRGRAAAGAAGAVAA